MNNDRYRDDFMAEFLTEEWISEQELCRHLGIGGDVLKSCLEWDVISTPTMNSEGHPIYHSQTVDRLGRGLRLHRDLVVNWIGVSIILDMLDRLELMESYLAIQGKEQEL